MANIPVKQAISCMRCQKMFMPPESDGIFACPHCGVWVKNLSGSIAGNKNAAMLAFLGLVVLIPGLISPFMVISKLGNVEEFSILSGVLRLFQDGEGLIASILFCFSVIFPLAKLIFLLAATSGRLRLTLKTRQTLHKISQVTGKYSMLDIFVLAIMVVILKLEGVAEVKTKPGTFYFIASVFLSMLSGICARFEPGGNISD